MAEQIIVRQFENQTFPVILAGQRYNISLKWNNTCQTWSVKVARNGNDLFGFVPLTLGRLIGQGLQCVPPSFGGLYLEVCDPAASGPEALFSEAQKLWFFDSAELYLQTGTVNP